MIPLPSLCPCAQTMVATVVIIVVLFQQSCSAKHCPPSSCGKIPNITYPFRLKGDPRGCGIRKYELDCINNVTMLTLFSGKYQVQGIDYKRFEIQLTDAGIAEDSACSIPRYFLHKWSFAVVSGPDYTTPDPLTLPMWFWHRARSIGFLNCTEAVTNDPRYVKVCDSRGHIYAVLGEYSFTMGDVKVGCHLETATFANEGLWISENWKNASYAEIHKGLVEGFSLSWLLPVTCKDRCGKGINCSFNETTQQVECDPQRYCHYVYHTTTKCGIVSQILGYTRGYLKGIIIGAIEDWMAVRFSVVRGLWLVRNSRVFTISKGDEEGECDIFMRPGVEPTSLYWDI